MRNSIRESRNRLFRGGRRAQQTRIAAIRAASTPCILEQLESRVLLSAAHHGTPHAVPAIPPGWHATPVVPIYGNTSNPTGFGADYAGSATAYGLTPAQMQGAYGLNGLSFNGAAGDGAGQTIAIIDAYNDPTIVSDLQNFDAHFGLADPPSFKVLNQTGGTTLPATDPAGPYSSTGQGDWEQEVALDVEWAHVMAPAANIILYEASNAGSGLYTAINAARNTAGVTVVSMSWGGSEFNGETSYDSAYFTTPAGHIGAGGVAGGITFLASTGDSGAYSSGTTMAVQYPAISPNVVAVGGTSLTVNGASYVSESGWGNGTNSASSGGSGGGISAYENQPAFQSGIVTQSTSRRTTPDVSIDGDPNTGVPIYDSYDFGASTPWVPGYEGGTSLACPMFAGVIAIADQDRALAGLGSLNGATQTLPKLYQLPSSDFHDVTTGNNGFAAGAGYDLVTGIGSPVGNLLIPDLANVTTPTPTPTPTLSISGPASVSERSAYTLNLSASDPGHTIGSWSITWGDGAVQTITGNPSSVQHTYTTGPNSYTISATATDDVGTYAAGNTVGVSVTHPPPVLTLSGASSVAERSAYTLNLAGSDPGHTIGSWSITWGDGAVQMITGNPASAQHTYATGPNSYAINATATDDVGTYVAGNTTTVTVTHVPPVLAISGASSISERSAYTLNLSASDPGHTIASWKVTWGDGSIQTVTGAPASVQHTYAAGPHSYTISASAIDDAGTYASGNSNVVNVTHIPPALAIYGGYLVAERSLYTLNLSANDPGHAISGWSINWGDGAIQAVTGNPASVQHAYAVGPNSYTISANATDDAGTYAAGNSHVVSVMHVAPVLVISGATTVTERSAYTLNLSASDPGHTISGWSINWGDGATQTVTASAASVTHTYAAGPNTYTVTATASDDFGAYPAQSRRRSR